MLDPPCEIQTALDLRTRGDHAGAVIELLGPREVARMRRPRPAETLLWAHESRA